MRLSCHLAAPEEAWRRQSGALGISVESPSNKPVSEESELLLCGSVAFFLFHRLFTIASGKKNNS